MKGRKINYSETEERFLRRHEKTPRRELRILFNNEFDRNISLANIKAKCIRMGLRTGRTGCFEIGNVSHNKGKKGWHPKGSEKGWFKAGSRPANQRPMGAERVCSKDGYVYIKIDTPNPHTGYKGHFVLKHRYLWEKENGPVPDGHFLKSIDGNKQNTDPSNWECLPNGMKLRLVDSPAGQDYNNAPDALKPIIMTAAKISQRVHELKRKDRDAHIDARDNTDKTRPKQDTKSAPGQRIAI